MANRPTAVENGYSKVGLSPGRSPSLDGPESFEMAEQESGEEDATKVGDEIDWLEGRGNRLRL
jgi:hypothetical protein